MKLPPIFIARVAMLNAALDKVNAAVAEAKDCKTAAKAISAFASDPKISSAISDYFRLLGQLTPEQVKLATSDPFTDKLSMVGPGGPNCSKDHAMLAARNKLSRMQVAAVENATLGVMSGPAPANSGVLDR